MKLEGIAICRQASDPLQPGFLTGYQCKVCKKGLQVSPPTARKIDQGELAGLCNPCGFRMAHELEKAGKDIETQITPQAADSILEIFRRK